VRSGWYRPVHVKSVQSHKLRLLLGRRSRLSAICAISRTR
jgi:transposase